ncbi:MAG: amidase [Chloroflexota bacterium]
MNELDICFSPATEQARMLQERELSARELTEAHLRQIERVNPKVNAICTLTADLALESADAADRALARGEPLGPLHGLPIGIKDLQQTRGILTTFGSPIYKDFIPDRDALIVERVKNAGGAVIGKTNTPEFGAGSQTFNPVFGTTPNAYDLSKTCGGSSGGAGVALACGMMPTATGSDLGGSLRNPAAWSNVVGIRPSPGRVPVWPVSLAWSSLSMQGPMGRTVADIALQLSAMAGPDSRSPVALPEPGRRFAEPLERDFEGTKIAWSRDLGRYPVEPVITEVCDSQRPVFEDLGCFVEPGEPDLSDADEIFQTLRAWMFSHAQERHLRHHRDLMKDTVVWNAEKGLELTGLDVARAEEKRTALYERVVEFFERYDFLALPVTSVPPFSVEQPYVTEVAGVTMQTYIDWMALCYAITVTGCPAVSVPCGFTPDGLPVGLQLVGPPRADFEVLQLAYAFESATVFWRRRPSVAS